VTGIDPQARLRWLQEIASKLPTGSFINITLAWENEHGAAGVHSYSTAATVYLNNAEYEVESLEEAASILRRIFADEVVAVCAYSRDQLVYRALAPASEPSAGFGVLDPMGSTPNMPQVDHVTIETWSGGLQEPD
jgi:hypothetical protein